MKRRAVISVEGLSKAFHLYEKPADLLYEFILRRPRHDVFWALKDISFQVLEGERLGIIGANGAGKSTLLKIITGNLMPTAGEVTVNGTISSMLSLASFLNDNETGLDNIRFNLLIQGVPEEDISRVTEEIIDFTELGSFIHSPVRTYSSGMNARLAFAISTAIVPDVLVVDEVLGVGDGYFVGKATQRMLELCDKGRALLYVSHSLSALQMLCDTAIWVDKGRIRMHGPVEHVLKSYEEDFRRREDVTTRAGNRMKDRDVQREVRPDELEDSSIWRLRLISASGRAFRDTIYVETMELKVAGESVPVSFEISQECLARGTAHLDVLDSEWGRVFERDGHLCRSLAATTGKRKGGHVLIRKPELPPGSRLGVELRVKYSTAAGMEGLRAEYLDEENSQWTAMTLAGGETIPEQSTRSSWQWSVFTAELEIVSPEAFEASAALVRRNALPDVAIQSVYLLANGERSAVVRERSPFSIVINAEVIRPVEQLDFGVRIIRSDGVYVFWQSSGQSGGNISSPGGPLECTFHFDPNLFASGRYNITVYAANGWDLEENYPYSEVFDRQVSVISFTVTRAHEKLDVGAVNQRVKTTISFGEETNAPQAPAIEAPLGLRQS